MRHNVVYALARKHRTAPDRAVDLVAEAEQILCQIGPVLTADPGYECLFQNDVFPITYRQQQQSKTLGKPSLTHV